MSPNPETIHLVSEFIRSCQPSCPSCGYALAEIRGTSCPECGVALQLTLGRSRTTAATLTWVILAAVVLSNLVNVGGWMWMYWQMHAPVRDMAAELGQPAEPFWRYVTDVTRPVDGALLVLHLIVAAAAFLWFLGWARRPETANSVRNLWVCGTLLGAEVLREILGWVL